MREIHHLDDAEDERQPDTDDGKEPAQHQSVHHDLKEDVHRASLRGGTRRVRVPARISS